MNLFNKYVYFKQKMNKKVTNRTMKMKNNIKMKI